MDSISKDTLYLSHFLENIKCVLYTSANSSCEVVQTISKFSDEKGVCDGIIKELTKHVEHRDIEELLFRITTNRYDIDLDYNDFDGYDYEKKHKTIVIQLFNYDYRLVNKLLTTNELLQTRFKPSIDNYCYKLIIDKDE